MLKTKSSRSLISGTSLGATQEAQSVGLPSLRSPRNKRRHEKRLKKRKLKKKPNVLQPRASKNWRKNISARWMSFSWSRSVRSRTMPSRKSWIDLPRRNCFSSKNKSDRERNRNAY